MPVRVERLANRNDPRDAIALEYRLELAPRCFQSNNQPLELVVGAQFRRDRVKRPRKIIRHR